MSKAKKSSVTTGKKGAAAPKNAKGRERRCGLLIELENVAARGRHVTYDVMKSVLVEKGVKLQPNLFSRYCVDVPLNEGLQDLLKAVEKTRLSTEKLAAEISRGAELSLGEESAPVNSGLKKLVARAREQGIRVGTLSFVGEETARKLSAPLELAEESSVLQVCPPEERHCPSADSWQRLARGMRLAPAACVALVAGAGACRAALGAGMQCVVVFDEFTAFQDFGGADLIVDGFGEENLAGIERVLGLAS